MNNLRIDSKIRISYAHVSHSSNSQSPLNQKSKEKTNKNTVKIVYSESETPNITTPKINLIQTKISPKDIEQYAKQMADKNSKGGFTGRRKIIEYLIGWQKFLYPYFDIEV